MPNSVKKLVDARMHDQTLVLSVRAAEVYQAEMIEQLGHDLRRAIEDAHDASRFVLDLSGVQFLTSGALGLVINLHSHLKGRGYPFAVAGATGEVAGVFERSHLATIMPLAATVADALKELQPPC
jgi:anti-anti-sigma factor